MKIVSIEPTPSPNVMKIIVDESLPDKETRNFKKEQSIDAPTYVRKLLEIDGVKSIFHVADFIALERISKNDWQDILKEVREAFGEEDKSLTEKKSPIAQDDTYGEVKVYVQIFRGIPMQVKLDDGNEVKRFGLPDRFSEAVMKAEGSSDNLVMEREWKEKGVRYGEMDMIGEEVAEELSAAFDDQRLNYLVKAAYNENNVERNSYESMPSKEVAELFNSEDWRVRYGSLEKLNPQEQDLPLLAKALNDEKVSIRRLATVYLGMIEDEQVLPYLFLALKDNSVTVRRTAGDCLSDLGSLKAIPAMVHALKDKNKLVRWRAAMFLYEVGDKSALEALREAQDDDEFEVSLQVKMALKRIESGEAAAGSVWQQMTEARKDMN